MTPGLARGWLLWGPEETPDWAAMLAPGGLSWGGAIPGLGSRRASTKAAFLFL